MLPTTKKIMEARADVGVMGDITFLSFRYGTCIA